MMPDTQNQSNAFQSDSRDVRELWFRVAEAYKNGNDDALQLPEGAGAPARAYFNERSIWFIERKALHQNAISAEEEFRARIGRLERENNADSIVTEVRAPEDHLKAQPSAYELNRFEVDLLSKVRELEDKIKKLEGEA